MILNLLACIPQSKMRNLELDLNEFIDDIIIPMNMRFDHDAELLGEGTEFTNIIKRKSINWNVTEPYCNWQNWSEDVLKRIWIRRKSNIRREG